MKKTTKVWLMIAASLILVGCILAKLSTVKYETNTYEVDKGFSDISISTLVKIKTSTGNICVENISADALDLSVITGKVTVSGVTCPDDITVNVVTGNAYLTDSSCRSVISSAITGSISLNNVIQEVCP